MRYNHLLCLHAHQMSDKIWTSTGLNPRITLRFLTIRSSKTSSMRSISWWRETINSNLLEGHRETPYGEWLGFPAHHPFYTDIYTYLKKNNPALLAQSNDAEDDGVTNSAVAFYMIEQSQKPEKVQRKRKQSKKQKSSRRRKSRRTNSSEPLWTQEAPRRKNSRWREREKSHRRNRRHGEKEIKHDR